MYVQSVHGHMLPYTFQFSWHIISVVLLIEFSFLVKSINLRLFIEWKGCELKRLIDDMSSNSWGVIRCIMSAFATLVTMPCSDVWTKTRTRMRWHYGILPASYKLCPPSRGRDVRSGGQCGGRRHLATASEASNCVQYYAKTWFTHLNVSKCDLMLLKSILMHFPLSCII